MNVVRSRRRLPYFFAVMAAMLAALVVVSPAMSQHKAQTLVIWSDHDRLAAVTKVANTWAASHGVTVQVVEKDFGSIRDSLSTVDPSTAPDVIVGAHDWTGQLAANGLVLPLYPSTATNAQFPTYTLNAFSYGTAVKKLYGAPVAIENIGLVVNTKLAHVPTTFADLESQALTFKKKKSGNLGIAVQQGANGDAYHMYPFFSGLGGYIFGANKAGNLDPSDIGVANKKFLDNATLIDKWNKEGLINSAVDGCIAQNAFLKGRRPSGSQALELRQLLEVERPLLQGRPASEDRQPRCRSSASRASWSRSTRRRTGSRAGAATSSRSYMTTPAAQLALAAANSRFPANTVAGKQVTDPVLAQFGKASVGGVPMPNIPQMSAVWADLGTAWVKSTKGAGATPARVAFLTASRNIADKIG